MFLIGSFAIKSWFDDFPREWKDLDYVCEKKPVIDKEHQENLYFTMSYDGPRSSDYKREYLEIPILYNYIKKNKNTFGSSIFGLTVNPDILYTLKMSHMFWDINWSKHLYDIQFLKEKNCKVIKPLFYDLYDYWEEFHGKNKRSDLKMTASQFFNNAVKCPHSHDWLHTLIKNPPTYTKVLFHDAEVEVSEDKFNDLSFEEKCDLVQEEIYVMAWERMPNRDYRFSYETMMKKFIISHAPLWEAIFILDNYKFLYKPKINFKKILDNGTANIDSNVK